MVQITIELDPRKKAGKENPAAERGHDLEAGVAEDFFFFYRFPLGFRGRKRRQRRQEGKGEEETSPA